MCNAQKFGESLEGSAPKEKTLCTCKLFPEIFLACLPRVGNNSSRRSGEHHEEQDMVPAFKDLTIEEGKLTPIIT